MSEKLKELLGRYGTKPAVKQLVSVVEEAGAEESVGEG